MPTFTGQRRHWRANPEPDNGTHFWTYGWFTVCGIWVPDDNVVLANPPLVDCGRCRRSRHFQSATRQLVGR